MPAELTLAELTLVVCADTENRYKFHLRHVSRAHMHTMGFHLVR